MASLPAVPNVAREHLARLYAPWLAAGDAPGRISTGARQPDGRGPWIAEAFACDAAGIAAAVAWAADQNAAGRSVYARPFLIAPGADPARITDGDVTQAAAVFADLDAPAEFEALERADAPRPSFVVETGRTPHRRAHVWWRLAEPLEPRPWRFLSQGLARFPGSDLMVCDVRTWARLAGFTAWPKDRERVAELVTLGADTGRRWTVDQLRRLTRAAPTERNTWNASARS